MSGCQFLIKLGSASFVGKSLTIPRLCDIVSFPVSQENFKAFVRVSPMSLQKTKYNSHGRPSVPGDFPGVIFLIKPSKHSLEVNWPSQKDCFSFFSTSRAGGKKSSGKSLTCVFFCYTDFCNKSYTHLRLLSLIE